MHSVPFYSKKWVAWVLFKQTDISEIQPRWDLSAPRMLCCCSLSVFTGWYWLVYARYVVGKLCWFPHYNGWKSEPHVFHRAKIRPNKIAWNSDLSASFKQSVLSLSLSVLDAYIALSLSISLSSYAVPAIVFSCGESNHSSLGSMHSELIT